MNIIKINSLPIFEIVPRRNLDILTLTIQLTSEIKNTIQTINCEATLLPNENYSLQLDTFPIGKVNEKFSYNLLNGTEILSLGKLMIVSENEIIQDYSKKTVNKFYK